jgi:hypothetical protein
MASNWRILGINDEVTTCECCARQNLKKVVVITNGDEERRYGTVCAAKALGRTAKEVEKEVKDAERRKEEEKARLQAVESDKFWKEYEGWLVGKFGDKRSDLGRRRLYRQETGK